MTHPIFPNDCCHSEQSCRCMDEPATREEQEVDAWEYWHQRAAKFELEAYQLRSELKVIAALAAGSDNYLVQRMGEIARDALANSK